MAAVVLLAACSAQPAVPGPDERANRKTPVEVGAEPAPCPGPDENQVDVALPDSTSVSALVSGSGPDVAVLAHQSDGSPCDLVPLGRQLVDQGWKVVAWSDDTAAGDDPVPVLAALVAAARAAGAQTVLLVGASIGGTISVRAAGGIDPPVDGVVALSSPDVSYADGTRLTTPLADYPGPALVVAARLDRVMTGAENLVAGHDGDHEVLIVDGSAHGKELVGPAGDDEVSAAVMAFAAEVRE